ncbi:MAG: PIN domain-containing protein [bacterium]|nr:PIN domain-containing protein [bacterium]
MRRAVLDPGVLVASLISGKGAPAGLLLAWMEGLFDLIVSPRLLQELGRVLARPKFRRYVSEDDAAVYVDLLRRMATTAEEPPDTREISPDPGDDYLVALARATDHVLTPRAFLDRMEWETP